jgi:ABC-type Mn2+/Zn2+ transport system permease subunit
VDLATWLTEPFALGFQQRALAGGVLAAIMTAVVGTWLVLRGMSFFGDAFVHGIVPGVAAAIALDVSPLLGAAVAAIVMVLAIEAVHRQTSLSEDTAIGLLFVGMLALGVVIVSRMESYAGSLTTILFGDILGITASGLAVQAAMAVLVVGAGLVLYRPLLALAFNPQKAELLGMQPGRAHAALLILIATAVIGSYQAVGTLLVFGLLVGPAATAALISRTVPAMMLTACGIGIGSVFIGLILSYHLDTAGSATMAIVPVICFFVVLTIRWATRTVGMRLAHG